MADDDDVPRRSALRLGALRDRPTRPRRSAPPTCAAAGSAAAKRQRSRRRPLRPPIVSTSCCDPLGPTPVSIAGAAGRLASRAGRQSAAPAPCSPTTARAPDRRSSCCIGIGLDQRAWGAGPPAARARARHGSPSTCRASGRLFRGAGTQTVPGLADAVEALARELGLGRFHVAGQLAGRRGGAGSGGGAVAVSSVCCDLADRLRRGAGARWYAERTLVTIRRLKNRKKGYGVRAARGRPSRRPFVRRMLAKPSPP